jgi:ribonucleoside-triphosphate reductase (formate)
MKYIIKRDGRKVPFDKMKIVDAVLAAFQDVEGEITDYALEKSGNIADYVAEIAETKELGIEEIQDLVEKGLMSTKRKDVAKSYILYREKRNQERQRKSAFTKEIHDKLMAADVQNSNANMDEKSFGGRKGAAADSLLKQYALDYCMSEMSRNNHLNNEIYIHDLDNYALGTHNCLTIPFDDLLAKGFNTRQTDVRPANSVNTAFQLVAVIFQLQSLQQFGGVSAGHLDWTMVPYVRKSFVKHWRDGYHYIAKASDELDWEYLKTFSIDCRQFSEKFPDVYKYAMDMTIKEAQQAAEGLFHNLNTLQSRSGN